MSVWQDIADLWPGRKKKRLEAEARQRQVESLRDRREDREEEAAPRQAAVVERARERANARREQLGFPPLAPLPEEPSLLPTEPVGNVTPTPAPEQVPDSMEPPGVAVDPDDPFGVAKEPRDALGAPPMAMPAPGQVAPPPVPQKFQQFDQQQTADDWEQPRTETRSVDDWKQPPPRPQPTEAEPLQSEGQADSGRIVELLERLDESTKQATEAAKATREAVEASQDILQGIQEALQQRQEHPIGYGP